jgi:hypothetical protein
VQLSQGGYDGALSVGALRAQRGTRGLDLKERACDIRESDLLRAQHQTDRVRNVRRIGPTHNGTPELAAPNPQQPLSLENAHGLPQRRLAHGELEQELVLLGEHTAIG